MQKNSVMNQLIHVDSESKHLKRLVQMYQLFFETSRTYDSVLKKLFNTSEIEY